MHAIVVNRCNRRDTRLAAEADKAIAAHAADEDEADIRLKTLLELQTILCTEYRYACHQLWLEFLTFISHTRNAYFTVINLIGPKVFRFVEDGHQQCDGVRELEAARIDDMVERIAHAAD